MKQMRLFPAILKKGRAKAISSERLELYIPFIPPLSKGETHKALLEKWGSICWGCNYEQPSGRHLEVDHIRPKVDGGDDYLPNRSLLCSPCNKVKGSRLTLHGLREHNQGEGYWNHDRPAIPLKAAAEWAKQEEGKRAVKD